MEIDGSYQELCDSDWITTPSFYRSPRGPPLPVLGAPCALEPALVQTGSMSAVRTSSTDRRPCAATPDRFGISGVGSAAGTVRGLAGLAQAQPSPCARTSSLPP